MAATTDYIGLINALAPLVTNLAPIIAAMIASISNQGGAAVEDILTQTGVQLDANDAKLVADLAKEMAAAESALIPIPTVGGTK